MNLTIPKPNLFPIKSRSSHLNFLFSLVFVRKGFHEIIPSGDESEKKKKKSGGDLDDLDAEKKKKKKMMKTSSEKSSGDQEAVKMENSSGEEEDLDMRSLDMRKLDMRNMGNDSFFRDSSDEEELSDSDKDQFYEYCRQLNDSGGFDLDNFRRLLPITHFNLDPLEEGSEIYLKVCRFSDKAINQYNSDHGTNYKFSKYVKSVWAACEGEKFYITFEAKELSSDDAPTTFQGLVWNKIPEWEGTNLVENAEVLLVRKKSEATEEHNRILLCY